MLSISLRPSRWKNDDVVDAVEELGPERAPQLRHHLVARAQVGPVLEELAADVGRHDDDGVAEVDRAPLTVGEAAVVEQLQQHVEHVGVRLLDLVEQDDRVGPAAHRLGELAALVVADVAGRRADQARHRVLLHVLGHVDADHVRLVVEQEVGERARQLGLADAGRAQEEERADRAGSGPAARRARGAPRWRPPSTASSWPMTRACSRSSMCSSFACSPSSILSTGMPVHFETTAATSSSVTSSRRNEPCFCSCFSSSAFAAARLLQLGDAAEAQLGGAIEIAAALRQLRLGLGGLRPLPSACAARR